MSNKQRSVIYCVQTKQYSTVQCLHADVSTPTFGVAIRAVCRMLQYMIVVVIPREHLTGQQTDRQTDRQSLVPARSDMQPTRKTHVHVGGERWRRERLAASNRRSQRDHHPLKESERPLKPQKQQLLRAPHSPCCACASINLFRPSTPPSTLPPRIPGHSPHTHTHSLSLCHCHCPSLSLSLFSSVNASLFRLLPHSATTLSLILIRDASLTFLLV